MTEMKLLAKRVKELEKENAEYLNTQTLPKIDGLVHRVIKIKGE